MKLAASAARWLPDPVKRGIYRFKPLAGLIRRALNRSAPQGLAQVTIAAGILEGWQAWLDLRSEKDYWLGTYEPELQQAVRDYVRPGMTIYDVGANIGLVALMFARAAGEKGQVVAIEALPANVKRLEQNSGLNLPHAQVQVVAAAAGSSNAPQTFLVHASTSMGKAVGSAGRDELYGQQITVEGVTLDHLAFEAGYPRPDVVKMDIEGGEVMAIPGMTRILNEVRPVMMVEIHGIEAGHAVYDALTAAGYTLHQMSPGYPTLGGRDQHDWKAYIIGLPPAA